MVPNYFLVLIFSKKYSAND